MRQKDLPELVHEALIALGGSASVVDVAKHIWRHRSAELESAGDLFYTWQYDMRWAAMKLRQRGVMKDAESSPKGIWILANDGQG